MDIAILHRSLIIDTYNILYIHMYIHTYIHIYVCVYIYIYILEVSECQEELEKEILSEKFREV